MKAGPLPRNCLLLPVEVRAAESNGILSSRLVIGMLLCS